MREYIKIEEDFYELDPSHRINRDEGTADVYFYTDRGVQFKSFDLTTLVIYQEEEVFPNVSYS